VATQERILILIKPDGVRRGLIGKVVARIEERDFTIEAMDMRMANRETLARHYHEHTSKPFYFGLVEYMTSGPIVAMVVAGDQVIETFRTMAGATDPVNAAPGTIRGDFGRAWNDGPIQNIVHGSDSAASAAEEIEIWFPETAESAPY